MSKNKVRNGWERRGALKKGKPHAIRHAGPSQTLKSKTFKESCMNTSTKYFLNSKIVSKLECKLPTISATKWATTKWEV